jgi:hypothetical protein
MSQQKNLKKLLEAENKDSLIDIILSLAADDESVEQRIKLLQKSKTAGNKRVVECRKLIRSYRSDYADKDGFINWRNVSGAVKGAEIVAEKAREVAKEGDWIGAVRIELCILEEMVDMLQVSDDSGGTVGFVIEESLERMHDLTLVSDCIPQKELQTAFQLLLDESKQFRFAGWPDLQLALIENASYLAADNALRKKWDEHVLRMSNEHRGSSWSEHYFAEQLAKMRYQHIKTREGEELAKEYLYQQLHFSEIRKIAIENALNSGNYKEVIKLAEEGEERDQANGLRGLVNQWKQYRLEAYQRSGEIDKLRKLGEELVLDGDYSCYQKVKDTYQRAEWPPVYKSLMQRLGEKGEGYSDIYPQILLEEHDAELLLEYVTKKPNRIEEYYLYLKEQFPEQVKDLLRAYIVEKADQSSTRKQYWNVCRIIRLLEKVGGKEEAVDIAHVLFAKYLNRPAFRDELMKLKYGMQ